MDLSRIANRRNFYQTAAQPPGFSLNPDGALDPRQILDRFIDRYYRNASADTGTTKTELLSDAAGNRFIVAVQGSLLRIFSVAKSGEATELSASADQPVAELARAKVDYTLLSRYEGELRRICSMLPNDTVFASSSGSTARTPRYNGIGDEELDYANREMGLYALLGLSSDQRGQAINDAISAARAKREEKLKAVIEQLQPDFKVEARRIFTKHASR